MFDRVAIPSHTLGESKLSRLFRVGGGREVGKQTVCSVAIALLTVSTMVVALFLGGIATTIAQNNGPVVSVSTNSAVAN